MMRRFISFVNALVMTIATILLIACPAFQYKHLNGKVEGFNGFRWLMGYTRKEEVISAFGVTVTSDVEYFKGKPNSGILLLISAILIILLSILIFVLAKKKSSNARPLSVFVLVLAVICSCFALFINNPTEFFSNSGIIVYDSLGFGAYAFFFGSMFVALTSFFSSLAK